MPQSRLNTFIIFCLCFLVIWAPIPLGSNRPWAWAILEIAIAAIFCLHLVQYLRQPFSLSYLRWQLPILLPLLLLQAYLALQTWQLIPSLDPYQTDVMLQKGIGFTLWAYLLLTYIRTSDAIEKLLIAVVMSGALQATYGVIIHLLDLPTSPIIGMVEGDRARGSFVYQNHFANYLGLCLALGLGLLLSQLSSRTQKATIKQLLKDAATNLLSAKFMIRLALIVMVIGLVLSRSRMGNAAFFVALIAVSLYAIWFYKRPPTLLKPLVISILILDMLVIGSMFGLEKLKQRYAETSFTSEARDEVVRDSMPLLEQHWLTGSGGGSFYGIFPAHQPAPYSGFYDHAHNDYLQFAIELGIPMSLLLACWILFFLWRAARIMASAEHKIDRGCCFGSAMVIIYMLLHMAVDFPLQSPSNTLLFLLALMLIAICDQRTKLGKKLSGENRHQSDEAQGY
jgi:O-antigen ligase